MEAARSSGAGSGNSATYAPEIAESFRFEDEIQSLVNQSFESSSPASNGAGGASFTALLGLQPSEAVELLHGAPDGAAPPAIADPGGGGGGAWRFRALVPTFPSNMALVERAARFSVFASGGESPDEASSGEYLPALARSMKAEPADSDPRPICPIRRPAAKRKEGDRNPNPKAKVRSPAAKRSRSGGEERKRKEAEESTGGEEKQQLPYVHVRARRGQATDSHSLAERARREKINARMKLLQELVPGCSKISGTALVLDEIINHVQSLQRQVEFLSMKLAAVNPRIDFSGLDAFLSAECGRLTAGVNHNYHQPTVQQQMWHVDVVGGHLHLPPPPPAWERDEDAAHHHLIGPPPPGGTTSSPFGYANAAAVSLSNQLKTEI